MPSYELSTVRLSGKKWGLPFRYGAVLRALLRRVARWCNATKNTCFRTFNFSHRDINDRSLMLESCRRICVLWFKQRLPMPSRRCSFVERSEKSKKLSRVSPSRFINQTINQLCEPASAASAEQVWNSWVLKCETNWWFMWQDWVWWSKWGHYWWFK